MANAGHRLPAGPLHTLALSLLAVAGMGAAGLQIAGSLSSESLAVTGLFAAAAVVALLGWWRHRRVEARDAAHAAEDRHRLQEALKERDLSRHHELHTFHKATVGMLAEALTARDPAARLRSEVAGYVAAVAARLDFDPRRLEQLMTASLLHDLGKLGISEQILRKPGPLSQEERDEIEQHPRIGSRLVEQVPTLNSIAPAVLHHHENFDGSGYPAGLSGEEIPLEARVIGVADCFSAMTSKRSYRLPLSFEDACVELERCAGAQFDPRVVRLFVDEVRRHASGGASSEDVATRARMALELGGVTPPTASSSA